MKKEPPWSESSEERLLEACGSGQLDKVKLILDEEASPPPYKKMMIAAAEHDHSEIVRYCLSQSGRISGCVYDAVAFAHAWKTHRVLVIDGGLDINQRIEFIGDFLTIAADHNEIDAVRFCLEHGADPNHTLVEDSLNSLAVAAVSDNASVDLAALLIEYGARIRGSGAIVGAAERGRIEIVKLLLKHGGDINEIGIKDYGDKRYDVDMGTPLHKAVGNRQIKMLNYLLDRGADAVRPDAQGRTPLQLATELCYQEEAAVLERHISHCNAKLETE